IVNVNFPSQATICTVPMRAFCIFLPLVFAACEHTCDQETGSLLQTNKPHKSFTAQQHPSRHQLAKVAKGPTGSSATPVEQPADDDDDDDDDDDERDRRDDAKGLKPWNDTCAVGGFAVSTSLLFGFVWLSSLWSAMSRDVSCLRIASNFGKFSVCILLFGILTMHFRARVSAMITCGITMTAMVITLFQLAFESDPHTSKTEKEENSRWPSCAAAILCLTLEVTTLFALTTHTRIWLQNGFLCSLLGEVVIMAATAAVNEGAAAPHVLWAAVAGHAVLPLVMCKALAARLTINLSLCLQDDEILSMRYSPAAGYSMCLFIGILWIMYQILPGICWRPAFLGVLLLILTPGMSHTTGADVLYGPWAMFGGEHEGWQASNEGLVIIAVASLLALAIGIAGLCGSSEVHTFEWSRRGAAPTLSLVRILLPFWIMEHVYWGGDDSPFYKWWSPQLMPGGDTVSSQILMRCLLLMLLLGIWAPFFAMLAAAGFCLANTRRSFDPDCPTQHVGMLLLILSFTPCDASYSLSSYLRQKFPTSRSWLGDAGDHLWARSLFRLHVSLLYFFAAIFKVQSEWLASGGGSLYKDIHIWELSPLSWIYKSIIHSKHSQQVSAHLMAIGIIVLEISISLGLWSKRFGTLFWCMAFAMHLGMVLLCGQLGGFSQAGWTGLLAIGHDKLEDILSEPKSFALATAGLIGMYVCIGSTFELNGPPM
ncbi:unnamed protein product, partial [Durusdinium trenchii]